MSNLDFATAVKQEEERLRKEYPMADDIPSCTTLFDDFLSCNILGKQLKSLYRYGRTSDCSQKLSDFKFCMSNKGLHPEEKRDAWIRRRAEWWAGRRLAKSSEDVWEVRTEPLKDFPPPVRPDLMHAVKTID
ncbi:hypothetical protein PUNSTDRAFT_120872 [Punctularia strigosozonata HHB-11173 SS5]|uniref:uncharacterized protein n=1 Tax=Punctularia strigosozonata (strain HHB-11173) TaxID=741275 RepID=UPI0004418492|nr:uncharacterized protein PUNSTDRAFT_120872 [Punctularia strigosozonata HHB-11173 SS5]EIN08612.1 hypothetical protein PUNSTDRAFT_120872 [Punctularia strigosozonata HHB-11173 SS5]